MTHEIWSMYSPSGSLESLVSEARTLDVPRTHSHLVDAGRLAVISITGPLWKGRTARIREQVRSAAADDSISGIVLRIDSPGGTVSGTFDLVADIRAAASAKPTVAHIEDLGASAAYAIATGASRILATESSLVGSIGTYGVAIDTSGLADRIGVKVHVIRAGEHKGSGVPGTEVTAEQLAEFQRVIDGINENFLSAVQTGRHMTRAAVEAVADGRVHTAADARRLGLIDGIASFDDVVSSFQSEGTIEMTKPDFTPAAATYQDLKQLPGVTSDFIVSQLDAGATMEAARTAWMADLAAKATVPGVDGLGGSGGQHSRTTTTYSDAQGEFSDLVEAEVDRGVPRARAVVKVVQRHPELREQMVAEANERRALRRA